MFFIVSLQVWLLIKAFWNEMPSFSRISVALRRWEQTRSRMVPPATLFLRQHPHLISSFLNSKRHSLRPPPPAELLGSIYLLPTKVRKVDRSLSSMCFLGIGGLTLVLRTRIIIPLIHYLTWYYFFIDEISVIWCFILEKRLIVFYKISSYWNHVFLRKYLEICSLLKWSSSQCKNFSWLIFSAFMVK